MQSGNSFNKKTNRERELNSDHHNYSFIHYTTQAFISQKFEKQYHAEYLRIFYENSRKFHTLLRKFMNSQKSHLNMFFANFSDAKISQSTVGIWCTKLFII